MRTTTPEPTVPITADTPEANPGFAVTCKGISKRYGSSKTVLNYLDISFVSKGITVLLGPSGCGKTTLLRCIAGLDTISAGSIEINGKDVTHVDARRRDVAMVFQNYALYPNKTVFKNIEFPLKMTNVPRSERRERVQAVVRLLRLEDYLDRRPSQLSGGQRQRVGIGRALVRNPAVLLMDEPLSNLDYQLRTEMRSELLSLQRRLGISIIFVTHDQTEALSLADHLVVMQAGDIEHAGHPEEVYRRPATKFVAEFLGGMNMIPRRSALTSRFDHALTLAQSNGDNTHVAAATHVGVRPEDLRAGPGGPSDLQINGVPVMNELLGRDRLLHLDAGGNRVRVRIPADTPFASTVVLHATANDLHFFDKTGQRVGR